jgi:hypothetical protein
VHKEEESGGSGASDLGFDLSRLFVGGGEWDP